MRRLIICLLALVISAALPARAFTVTEVSRVNVRELQRLVGAGTFIVDVSSTSVAAEKGEIFLLAREFNTRKLHWFIFDLAARRVLKQGPCPFVGFSAMAVSPDARRAMVFSTFPVEAYALQVDTGTWTRIHENPRGAGLSILGVSPLAWVSRTKACALLDERDAEHYAVGTCVTSLPPVEAVVSLATLKRLALRAVYKSEQRPADVQADVEEIRFGESQSLLYTFKTLNQKTGRFVDHLLRFDAAARVTPIDTVEGELFPLDFDPAAQRALYRRITRGLASPEVVLYNRGKKTAVLRGKALVGGFLADAMIGVSAVSGEGLQIFVGRLGQPLTRVFATPTPYATVFLRSAPMFVLQSSIELRLVRVDP